MKQPSAKESYGTTPDNPTKATPRPAAVKDNATKSVGGGSGGVRGAGKGMKG